MTGLSSVQNIVVLMLENRSMDHMLGYLYQAQGNVSPTGQPFEGLGCTATEYRLTTWSRACRATAK